MHCTQYWSSKSILNQAVIDAMDVKILRSIINSTNLPIKNDVLFNEKDIEEFPITNNVIVDGLCKRITQNLTFKVSQEATQRYSVRVEVIETLRDWSRLKGDIRNTLNFQDSEQSHNFFVSLYKKYVKTEHLSKCSDVEQLIPVANVLLNSIDKDRSLIKSFDEVVERIISLDQTERSQQFLKYVIDNCVNLQLELSFIEKIFVSLKAQFIEKPLADCFVAYCSDKNKKELQLNHMRMLFKKVIDSPVLFALIINYLRELFIQTKFSKTAQAFIKEVLGKIQSKCKEYHKDMLELYPVHLQYCVLLLRIKPTEHIKKSKNQTVDSLQEIFLNEYNDALMLVSHFPDWLPEYIEFSENLDGIIQEPEVICID